MKSSELRSQFLRYFEQNGHTQVASSPLIPIGDPSLLFTTAGMVQFKPMFAGESELKYTRATSCQKCFRTSDLENVGRTPRHHTFFEMLGNFSFGGYFKKKAVELAWEFSTDIVQLDKKLIHVAVYLDDDEAYNLWTKHIGVPDKRVVRLGKKDNFWGPAGASGACGPCSELYYDLGEEMSQPGDDPTVGGDNNRYLEYWNLVFNQYNQLKSGDLVPLPKTGIDTGMGLERLTLISQGVKSVYDTDLFKPFINQMSQLSKIPYNNSTKTSYNVIADHIRGVVFVLAENILPSNEGRGYVIRRLLRRAIRFGQAIGIKKPFLYQLVPLVTKMLGKPYPEIVKNKAQTEKIIRTEEEIFFNTLEEGSAYLETLILKAEEQDNKIISGKDAFKLYDSMGFPIDLTEEIVQEKGYKVDVQEYNRLMDQQKERGKKAWKQELTAIPESILDKKQATEYVGDTLSICESNILYIIRQNKDEQELLDLCSKGDSVIMIVSNSPFYGESGGQVGDHGEIRHGEKNIIQVTDTQRVNKLLLHVGKVIHGNFTVKDRVTLIVANERKKSIARNHSATHILQRVLQKVLGEHIRQMGSLVNEEKLRFDFAHFHSLSEDELNNIEKQVNVIIRDNVEVSIKEMEQDEALREGALAFFGEKYDLNVRTVKMGSSFELCGGTHVQRSGDIGTFKIINESSIASGTRRIEAVTGEKANTLFYEQYSFCKNLELLLNRPWNQLNERISTLIEKNKRSEKEIQQLKKQLSAVNTGELVSKGLSIIGDIHYISFSVSDQSINELREINDQLKSKYKKLITLLFSEQDDKVFYLSTISKDLSDRPIKANELVKKVSESLSGKGGGKPDRAQGSGSHPEKIPQTISDIKKWVKSNLT